MYDIDNNSNYIFYNYMSSIAKISGIYSQNLFDTQYVKHSYFY